MVSIQIWLLCLLVACSIPTIVLVVFAIVYFIALIHDLHCVKYEKKECPYEIEVDQ